MLQYDYSSIFDLNELNFSFTQDLNFFDERLLKSLSPNAEVIGVLAEMVQYFELTSSFVDPFADISSEIYSDSLQSFGRTASDSIIGMDKLSSWSQSFSHFTDSFEWARKQNLEIEFSPIRDIFQDMLLDEFASINSDLLQTQINPIADFRALDALIYLGEIDTHQYITPDIPGKFNQGLPDVWHHIVAPINQDNYPLKEKPSSLEPSELIAGNHTDTQDFNTNTDLSFEAQIQEQQVENLLIRILNSLNQIQDSHISIQSKQISDLKLDRKVQLVALFLALMSFSLQIVNTRNEISTGNTIEIIETHTSHLSHPPEMIDKKIIQLSTNQITPIRIGPSKIDPIIHYLPSNQLISYVKRYEDWVYVEYIDPLTNKPDRGWLHEYSLNQNRK